MLMEYGWSENILIFLVWFTFVAIFLYTIAYNSKAKETKELKKIIIDRVRKDITPNWIESILTFSKVCIFIAFGWWWIGIVKFITDLAYLSIKKDVHDSDKNKEVAK
jgi:hypothetical protein